jgi:peptide/nickel transport system ATP-binding protein
MYAGRIVELGSADTIFSGPQHPYTWGLLRSIPRLDTPRDRELVPIPGRPPSLINRPSGCAFHPRCPYVREAHKQVDPQLAKVEGSNGHLVACLLPGATRTALWQSLVTGESDQAAKADIGGLPDQLSASAAVDKGAQR